MSKAAELAALIGSQTALSNRNMIINGAMQVAQRGTSFTATGSYPVDRFSVGYGVTGGTFTVSQDTTSPTDFSNSIKYLVGTAASAGSSEQAFVGTTFEGYSTSHLNFGTSDAKAITLSFWVRSSVTGTYCVAFINNAFDRSYIAEYSISSADTWEYKTITVSGDTSGTWVGAVNTRSMLLRFDLGSGSSFNTTAGAWQSGSYRNTSSQTNLVNNASATWYVTGVQLEVGEQDTPFEHRSFGDELARCQRYYLKIFSSASRMAGRPGFSQTNQANRVGFEFPMEMRSAPTYIASGVTLWDGVGTYNNPPLTAARMDNNGFDADYTVTGITVSRPVWYFFDVSSDYLDLSAEL